jgi:hypothetical protein
MVMSKSVGSFVNCVIKNEFVEKKLNAVSLVVKHLEKKGSDPEPDPVKKSGS